MAAPETGRAGHGAEGAPQAEQALRALLDLAALDGELARRQAAVTATLAELEALRRRITTLGGGRPAARRSESGAQHAALSRQLQQRQRESESVAAALHTLRQALPERRSALRRRLPVDLIAAYETALHAGHSPLVATRGGACWGCGLALPAKARSEFGASRRVVVCPHCARLLYDPSWLEGV